MFSTSWSFWTCIFISLQVNKNDDEEHCFLKYLALNCSETISVLFLSIFSRQGSFFYQVSLDHYRDSEFLVDAFTRYRMYLFLKKQYKDKFLVPCYDMDLVWHTHQVSTLHYTKDMNAILGFVLKHDDSVNDR